MKKSFIIEHIKRNRTVYQICLFIFRMFIAGLLCLFFLRASGKMQGSVGFFDVMMLAAFIFNTLYMKRLVEFSDTALEEIGANLPYSEGTKIVLKLIIRDPKRLRTYAALMFLMAFLVETGAVFILWTIRENAQMLEIIVAISFMLIGIPLFALGVTYKKDADSLKKDNGQDA